MLTNSMMTDFPKNRLKFLFLEAKQIVIIQPPQMGLAIMTENFSAGARKALLKFSGNQSRDIPKLIVCTAFPDIFRHDPSLDMVIDYPQYSDFLKKQRIFKQNLLVIDLSSDDESKFLFEYDRMLKWPVRQRPFYSQITFHWQNLPQGNGEENSIASRYLTLVEQIFGEPFFSKPRFPKVFLPTDTTEIFSRIITQYSLEPKKYKEVSIFYPVNLITDELNTEKIILLMELLTKKKRNLEVNLVVDPAICNHQGIKLLTQKMVKKQGFSLIRTKKFNVISLGLKELAVFLSKQRLLIGPNTGLLHLANALGVKTISLGGFKSRHFISNYRWDNPIYPPVDYCIHLKKTDTWKGKGYLAPCYEGIRCDKPEECALKIDSHLIVRKAAEIL